MEDHRNGLGAESGNIVSIGVADEGRRQSGRQAESIGEFGRREWRGNSVGYPEPAELSTGRRRGEAAHPLHLTVRSKNDQIDAID